MENCNKLNEECSSLDCTSQYKQKINKKTGYILFLTENHRKNLYKTFNKKRFGKYVYCLFFF